MSNSPKSAKLLEMRHALGPEYSIRLTKLERVIYRKLSSSFDIEISGLNTSRTSFNCDVFLWERAPGRQILERFQGVSSFVMLTSILKSLVNKYQD